MNPIELAIITLKKDAGEIYANQIRYFLGDNIKINLYSFEEENLVHFKEKLILLSVYLKYDEIAKISDADAQIIIPKLTFEKSSIEKLSNIEKDKTVFVYNLSKDMSLETISLIYKLGIEHLNLIPCYPGVDSQIEDSIILTPGEKIIIDIDNCEIIDLEYRIIDLSCIVEIATKLNIEHLIKDDLIKKFMDKVIPTSYSTEKLLFNRNKLENQFDLLLSIIDDGIICINHDGIVQFYSHIARKILDIDANNMIGKFIGNYINDIDFTKILDTKTQIYEKLTKINNIDVNVEVKYVQLNIFDGFIIKITKFYKTEKKQAKLRAQLVNSGNISRYTFDDIIGCSKEILNTKALANKMAKSNSSILIIGESGTGKELFAQSIHNASNKNFGPFVAVNCSTFQANLLESELFGYDDGAFTGAKKGGKIGLFELANNGTIFLDEIGEMDLNSQAKLLRVIQEKQVRRIGSDKVINIDVRIIAATNRDLKELVEKGTFRKDLYFRLNVLPLKIKPLRERIDDVFLIFESFKSELESKFELSEDVKSIFANYCWEGNIRELKNIAEYFSYLDKDVIGICDLPEYILDYINSNEENDDLSNITINKVIDCSDLKRPISEYLFVLEQLQKAYNLKQRIGRRKLYELALKEEVFLTEQQIRTILIELQELGYVKISTGRGGSTITSCGIHFLNNNK